LGSPATRRRERWTSAFAARSSTGGFGSGHFGGEDGIPVHRRLDGAVEAATDFVVEIGKDFFGDVADAEIGAGALQAGFDEAEFDDVADVGRDGKEEADEASATTESMIMAGVELLNGGVSFPALRPFV